MLQQHQLDDYVIAFAHVELDYRQYDVSELKFWRAAKPVSVIDDECKTRRELRCSPDVTFESLVIDLIGAEHFERGCTKSTRIGTEQQA